MSDTLLSAYLVRENDKDYLCTIEKDGFFQKLEINPLTIARLAHECSERLWDEIRGKYGATPNP